MIALSMVAQAPDRGDDTLALILSAAAAAIALAALAHSILTSRHERRDRRHGLDLLERQIAVERERRDEEQQLLELRPLR